MFGWPAGSRHGWRNGMEVFGNETTLMTLAINSTLTHSHNLVPLSRARYRPSSLSASLQLSRYPRLSESAQETAWLPATIWLWRQFRVSKIRFFPRGLRPEAHQGFEIIPVTVIIIENNCH